MTEQLFDCPARPSWAQPCLARDDAATRGQLALVMEREREGGREREKPVEPTLCPRMMMSSSRGFFLHELFSLASPILTDGTVPGTPTHVSRRQMKFLFLDISGYLRRVSKTV